MVGFISCEIPSRFIVRSILSLIGCGNSKHVLFNQGSGIYFRSDSVRPLAGHRAAILFLQHVATHHSDFFLGLKKKQETTYPLRTFFHGTPHILFHLYQH